MSKALYELYIKDVMKLSKTLVIKSSASAEILNARIRIIGHPVDDSRPSTWKYYLNLAGEYHNLDEPMSVKSLDTLVDIDFTKENLMVHRATAKAYAYGTPYYRSLVDRFPKQEQLILGILNPVPVDVAIKAPDHAILWYDKTLVESNEANLIPELQLFIDAWWRKWNSPAYDLYHDLYVAGLYSAFFSALPGAILGIRLQNCNSQYAHSFHIWSYLAGKGKLDDFREYLTREQTLWLYRNIDWLTTHVGKTDTMEELIEHLLTARGFPVVGYDLLQNTSNMPKDLRPEIDLLSIPLNFLDQQPRTRQTRTVEQIVEKEIPLARENEIYTAQEISDVNDKMKNTLYTRVPTKVLESQVVDRSESKHVKLLDVLINHWLYLSHNRRYNAIITVSNPQTGEAFNISVREAFVLWIWLYNHAQGLAMTYVPSVRAKRVRRPELPSFDSLRKLVPRKYVDDALIKAFYEHQPPYGMVVSTAGFNELGRELYAADLYQYELYTKQEHMRSRVNAELVSLAFWCDSECKLVDTPTTYGQWFKERGLLVEDLGKFDALTLWSEILDKATGQDLSKQFTLKEIQAAMLSLFGRLSSYSIQTIQTISDSPLIPVGFPTIRPGDDNSVDLDHDKVQIPITRVTKDRTQELDRLSADAIGVTVIVDVKSQERDVVELKPFVDIKAKGPGRDRMRLRLPNLRWTVKETP